MSKNVPANYQNLLLPTSLFTTSEVPINIKSRSDSAEKRLACIKEHTGIRLTNGNVNKQDCLDMAWEWGPSAYNGIRLKTCRSQWEFFRS